MADYYTWGGSIPTDIQTFARGICLNSPLSDYYFCRSGPQEYTLCLCKDFDFSTLTGSDCTIYRFYNDGTGSYGYKLDCYDTLSCVFDNSSGYTVFCSCPGSSILTDGGDRYAFAQTLLLGICCCFFLADRIFRHVS